MADETHAQPKIGGDLALAARHMEAAAKEARKDGDELQARRYETAAACLGNAVECLNGSRDVFLQREAIDYA